MKNHFKDIFIILMLFILGIDMYGVGHYITFILLPYLILFSIIKRFVDRESLWLLSFSIFYVIVLFFYPIVWQKYGIAKMLSYLFLPFSAYISGKHIIGKNYNFDKIFLLLLLFTLAIGILPITSVLYDIYAHGFIGGSRNMALLNGTNTERSATGINGYIIIMASLIGLLMFPSDNEKTGFYKWLFISFSFISFICILRLGSRTGLLIIAMSILGVLVYNIKKHGFRFYLLLISSLGFLVLSFMSYISPLFTYITMRSNEGNLDTAGSRFPLWNYYFFHLLDYPMGNIPSIFSYTPFAHNLWLDVGRLTGIIPLFFLLIFTFSAFHIFFRFINNPNFPPLYKNVILVWHIAIYAVFFVEPVIEGLFTLFIFYCFMIGMIKQSNTLTTLIIENEENITEQTYLPN